MCQYVYDGGLYFMMYKHPPLIIEEQNQTQWVADAKQKWGDYFLGLYIADDFGGRQIDGPICP